MVINIRLKTGWLMICGLMAAVLLLACTQAPTLNAGQLFELNILVEGAGSVQLSPEADRYRSGALVSLQAVPAEGHCFMRWEGDSTENSDSIELVLCGDTSLTAVFAGLVSLDISVLGSGSVQVSSSSDSYPIGTKLTLQAIPDEGSSFIHWEGDSTETSDSIELELNANTSLTAVFSEPEIVRTWTIAVYMSGDNDLEAAMMYDLNQLECLDLPQEVEILALVDRHANYDSSDGNWTDTRYYRLRHDPAGQNSSLISERLAAGRLGLAAHTELELNMGDGNLLASFIEQVQADWPAENYALIMWGHGSGWRGDSAGVPVSGWKGLMVDDAADDMLFVAEFGRAVRGKNISLIGLDICYGALMELAWELRNDADLLVASQEAVPTSGWDYEVVFNTFLAAETRNVEALAEAIVDSYARQYAGQNGACLSVVRLDQLDSMNDALNALCISFASTITDDTDRDAVLDGLLNETETFSASAYPSDLFIDIGDMARYALQSKPALATEVQELQATLTAAVYRNWTNPVGNPAAAGLSLYLASLDENGNVNLSHSPAYFRNAIVQEPLDFVQNSNWVPTQPIAESLLDVLWYQVF
ncbi:MAG: hypothetical protein KKI09_01755 [Spirochaetes bacterium]|nr:hypothetical protein [Spirochaetota bacterium]